jgi:uncharacterized protein YlxW (UPF0749 family)
MTDPETPDESAPAMGANPSASAIGRARHFIAETPRWTKIVVPTALVVGLVVGAAVATYTPAATASPSYTSMHNRLVAQNKSLQDAADSDQSALSDMQSQIDQFTSQAQSVKDAETALAALEAAVAAREAAVKVREDTAAAAAAVVASNSFAGDGVYIVGKDIQAGQYKSAGGAACYWARQDTSGGTIDNYIGSGPAVVTVRRSDTTLEVSGCEPFTKVG